MLADARDDGVDRVEFRDRRDGVAEGIDALYRPTEDSQAFRLTAVNKKRRKEIDHRYSNHALALQSSRYIQVKQSFQDIQN